MAAGVANNNISVVDRAEIPRGQHKPQPLLNILLALVLGLEQLVSNRFYRE